MVLRSGRRRSLETPDAKEVKKKKQSRRTEIRTEDQQADERGANALKESDVQNQFEDDDNDAPEDVGFSAVKEIVLEELGKQKKQKLEQKALKAEVNRKKAEKRQEEKLKSKAKKKGQDQNKDNQESKALPDDFLAEMARRDELTRQNTIKKFEEEDDNEEDELNNELSLQSNDTRLSRYKVVSQKDLTGLKHVSDSVLTFRERLLYGDKKRIPRESIDEVRRRKEKLLKKRKLM